MSRPNPTFYRSWIAALLLLFALSVKAEDSGFTDFSLRWLVDARAAHSDSETTWLEQGLGKGRYDSTSPLLELSEVSLVAEADFNWQWQGFTHLKYDPEQDQALDLVEAYVRFNPVPDGDIRYRIRAGLLFPHISRENRGLAWTTPFSITPSAINSWVGEEIRTLALEGSATHRQGPWKMTATAAIFGFNDPAGSLLAYRGWAMHDLKVGAFSRVPLPPLSSIGSPSAFSPQPLWVDPVREVDNRPGFYGALDWEYERRHKFGAFFYDNRGDPEVFKRSQYAWDTHFWNLYFETKLPASTLLIAQYMTGRTQMGPESGGVRQVDVDFEGAYLLATKQLGDNRVTLRRDWFDADDNSFVSIDNNGETGSAWTLALSHKLDKNSRLIAEFIRIDSRRPNRADLGLAARQTEHQFQLSYRLSL